MSKPFLHQGEYRPAGISPSHISVDCVECGAWGWQVNEQSDSGTPYYCPTCKPPSIGVARKYEDSDSFKIVDI